jgi:hypothetical protein
MSMPKMEKITVEQAKAICKKKGLSPARVKGAEDAIQFTRGKNTRLEQISWDEFEKILATKKLAVYNWKGWMKIGKK